MVLAGPLRISGIGEITINSMKERLPILDFVRTKKPGELGTFGRHICFHMEIVCLGMKPTQRKTKPSFV